MDEPRSLDEALERHGIGVPEDARQRLDAFRGLLWEWNDRINLTRHTTFEKFVVRDVVDSLELAQLLQVGERVLDVGTGGGVPGVVLAILRPDLQISLSETTGKKARAVADIVRRLGLDVPAHHARAEEVLDVYPHDTLVARAVAPIDKMLRWLQDHWDSFGRLLLIKGKSWVDERGQARHFGLLESLQLRKAASYQTPGTQADNVILSFRKADDESADVI